MVRSLALVVSCCPIVEQESEYRGLVRVVSWLTSILEMPHDPDAASDYLTPTVAR